MNVKLYTADPFCENYMPFLLFKKSVCDILSNRGYNNDFFKKISLETSSDLSGLENFSHTLVFINMYDLTLFKEREKIRECILQHNNVRFIVVNTEHWETRGAKEVFQLLQERNQKNVAILEYNIINYNNIVNRYPQLHVLFLPLIDCHSLRAYFRDNVPRSLARNEKDIDVLFYGGLNDRRKSILNEIAKSCRLHIVDSHHGATNKELCNLIERSVVVVNILYYDFNVVFDYYRNSLLLANNAILVTELPKEMDVSIEPWLAGISEIETFCSYDQLVETTTYLVNSTPEQIQSVKEKQRAWFEKFDMNDILVPFINYYQITNEFPVSN